MIGCPLENHPGHKNRDTPGKTVASADHFNFDGAFELRREIGGDEKCCLKIAFAKMQVFVSNS